MGGESTIKKRNRGKEIEYKLAQFLFCFYFICRYREFRLVHPIVVLSLSLDNHGYLGQCLGDVYFLA